MPHPLELFCRLFARVVGPDRERGDVPGWVLVTIMTAGLVSVLWGVAGDRFVDLFNNALDSVAP